MWNLKKYFLIGYAVYMQMLRYETIAAGTTSENYTSDMITSKYTDFYATSTPDIGSDNFSTANSHQSSVKPSPSSLISDTPNPYVHAADTPSRESFTSVKPSTNSLISDTPSPYLHASDTPSRKSFTSVKPSTNSLISDTPSPYVHASDTLSPQSLTSVKQIPYTNTSDIPSLYSHTSANKSLTSVTPPQTSNMYGIPNPFSHTPDTTNPKSTLSDTTMTYVRKSENESQLTEETDTTAVLRKDTVPVKVELVVKIEKPFQIELMHKTSPLYKNYTTEFKTKLVEVYKTMKNFVRIDVIGFRNGSTICDYVVILTPGSVTGTGNDDFKELQEHTAELNKTNIFDSRMMSPNASIAKVFQANTKTNPCYAIDCGRGYSCDKVVGDSVTCKHICSTLNKCQHEGECLFDSRHELPHCRCKQDSNYMYSGDYCEVKVEKFTMSKTNIIAIAAGAGGGVVLLLLVVIVALGVKYRRRHTHKQRDGKPDPLSSVSMDDLRFETRDSSRSSDGFLKRPKIYAAENPYQSGLPDTKYVQGREHKVMKDYKGQETYLYQPTDQVKRSSRSSVASSSYTDHINKHVYDHIDTDSKFEIQRPNIRLGYLDKF